MPAPCTRHLQQEQWSGLPNAGEPQLPSNSTTQSAQADDIHTAPGFLCYLEPPGEVVCPVAPPHQLRNLLTLSRDPVRNGGALAQRQPQGRCLDSLLISP